MILLRKSQEPEVSSCLKGPVMQGSFPSRRWVGWVMVLAKPHCICDGIRTSQ